MINKEELKNIIEILKEVCKDKNISDEVIFKESCIYHRGLMIEKNRSGTKTIQEQKEEPATEPQKNYIYKNNLDIDTTNLTKREAHAIIKQHKGKYER